MALYKVVSTTPVTIDHENGSVVCYPRNTIFEANPKLRDVVTANRRRTRIVALGETAPASVREQIVPAPGPSTKSTPKPEQPARLHNLNMPRVSYAGRTFVVDELITG